MAKHELELSARHLPAEIQAVYDFIESGVPENTIKSYSGALNRLAKWLGDRQLHDASLASYLTWLFAQGHAKSSAVLIVSAVNKMAKANNQSSPVGGLTKEALSSYRRQVRDRGRGSVSGIRFEVADLLSARTNKDTLKGLRDAAILRVMSDGLLRVSELVGLEIRDIEFSEDGSATISVRHSKSDQEAEGSTLYVGEPTAHLVSEWLQVLRERFGIRAGRVFRSVRKGEASVGESISVKAVQLIVKQAVDEAHLPGRFGTHSFRIGSAESLAERGCSLPQLMQIGRWSSSEMVGHYTRKQLASRSAMARLRYGS